MWDCFALLTFVEFIAALYSTTALFLYHERSKMPAKEIE
jgi:hypothetical protein